MSSASKALREGDSTETSCEALREGESTETSCEEPPFYNNKDSLRSKR